MVVIVDLVDGRAVDSDIATRPVRRRIRDTSMRYYVRTYRTYLDGLRTRIATDWCGASTWDPEFGRLEALQR